MAEITQHLTALAEEIGPRPATTDAEHRAAEYVQAAFVARGLEPEVQEFEAPRTYAWAYVVYHLLTLASAFLAGFKSEMAWLGWVALAVSAITAFLMWGDLDTKWGLSRLFPKGPSQNVIARHVPKVRRGERLRRIVVVAHYDSARSSLAFAPGAVGRFPVTFALMKACTFAVPVMILAMRLPFTAKAEPYLWYATMAVSAYLLVPLVINVHRELFMPFVDGANDNASGVAAMLGVLNALVPEPDASRFATTTFAATRRGPDAAYDAEVVPEGALLSYSPAGGSAPSALPDDFAWVEPTQPVRGQRMLEFETIEFAAVGPATGETAREPEPERYLGPGPEDEPLPAPEAAPHDEPRRKRGLLGGLRRDKNAPAEHDDHDVKGWLGVDDRFDARKAGREIGSWDRFGEDDDDAGGLGWKGGWAGDDPIGDPDFAANEAARIRRRVTETVDRDLTEKEVWFVATGAEEVGTIGMQAFLREYGEEVRDAFIINLDNIGAGNLHWITAEGMARTYRADRRLTGLAKRVSREQEIMIKPRVFKGLSTDATPALARGYKAMSIMALDNAGVPVNWHWRTDTAENVEPELVERVATLVTHMIREA